MLFKPLSSVRIIVGAGIIALVAVAVGMIRWDIPYWFIQAVSVLFVFASAIIHKRRIYFHITLMYMVAHLVVDMFTGHGSFWLVSSVVQWLSIIVSGEVIYQISSQRRKSDELSRWRNQHLALTDMLTGVHNRRRLFELLDNEYKRAIRYQRPLSFMLVDIDHFKKIHDAYGQSAGDEVLRWFAAQCSSTVRQKLDFVGRFGGEEFAIIYPEADLAAVIDAAERLRSLIIGHKIPFHEEEIQVTFSARVASLPLDGETTFEQLIERADKALYFAKEKRDCMAYWDDQQARPHRIP